MIIQVDEQEQCYDARVGQRILAATLNSICMYGYIYFLLLIFHYIFSLVAFSHDKFGVFLLMFIVAGLSGFIGSYLQQHWLSITVGIVSVATVYIILQYFPFDSLLHWCLLIIYTINLPKGFMIFQSFNADLSDKRKRVYEYGLVPLILFEIIIVIASTHMICS